MSLKFGDLKGTLKPKISIDEFEPKAGSENDTIVVAFYLEDEDPAADLNTFIQRGFIDTLDVEVSPNTDDEGNYLVFVEMNRNDSFINKFHALIKDVENITGKLEWEVSTYLSNGRTFKLDDPELFNFVIIDPTQYVTKDEFKVKSMKEDISNFFNGTLLTNLTLVGNTVTLSANGKTVVAEVSDVGEYDAVIGRNFLSESAFRIGQNPYESKVLESMIGNCQILPLGKYLCISKDDKVVLLTNTRLEYRTK